MKRLILTALLPSLPVVWSGCNEEKKTPLAPGELGPGKVVATIPVGHTRDPHRFVEPTLMTPDGRFFYGMDCENNTVFVVNLSSHKVVKIISIGEAFEETEDLACSMAVTPDSRYVYVNYNQTDEISVIETSSNEISEKIVLEDSGWAISITPDGRFAYVPLLDDESVSVISTSSNEVVQHIALPERLQPMEVVIPPDGKYGYVIGWNNWLIHVINLSSNQVVKTIDTGLGNGIRSQGHTTAIAMPDSRFVYMTFWQNGGSGDGKGRIIVIDTSSNDVVKTIGGRGLISMAPDGKIGYMANYDGSAVSVIGISSHEVVKTIPVGSQSRGIATTPDGSMVYVANYGDGTVSVIDASAQKVVGIIAVGQGPERISITPDGRFVYVVNGDDTISVIER